MQDWLADDKGREGRHRGRTSAERGVRLAPADEAAEIGAPLDTAGGYHIIQDNLSSSKFCVSMLCLVVHMFCIFFQLTFDSN